MNPAALHPTQPTLARDLRWLGAGLLLTLGWDLSGLDLRFTRLFGSATGFAWRDTWLLTTVMHDASRVLSWALLLVVLSHAIRPWIPGLTGVGALTRRERWWWVGATLAVAAIVPLMKQGTLISCPWELAEFGGKAHPVPHWAWRRGDGGPGHCFPSGHASTSFVWFTGFFALRRAHPVAARRWAMAVLVMGLLLGVGQVMRGAHHLSHVLWSGWICGAAALVLAALFLRHGANRKAAPP